MEKTVLMRVTFDANIDNASKRIAEAIENEVSNVECCEVVQKIFKVKKMNVNGVCISQKHLLFDCIEDAEKEYPESENYFVIEYKQ